MGVDAASTHPCTSTTLTTYLIERGLRKSLIVGEDTLQVEQRHMAIAVLVTRIEARPHLVRLQCHVAVVG